MTTLSIFRAHEPDGKRLLHVSDTAEIMKRVQEFDVTFERWEAGIALSEGAGQDDVLSAYARDVERLKAAHGYQSVDVVRMHPEHPERTAARGKFLSEHRHDDDEVRFFVEGAGAFYLRNDAHVFQIVCEAGDLLSVPANTRHWFDMGPRPHFAAIRLFTRPDGWVATFTGDPIADHIPKYEDEAA
ncbi:MAG TPA: cupin [Alphaproteobacteria bacterium]|nr:cupin [Alphaproteobacteria bacterium]